MHDVWVSGAFDAREAKAARGAWLCPELGLYGVTKRCKATDLNDGLRVGCAMAILSALNSLGEGLTVHLPKYPAPRWVTDPRRTAPLPNMLYRILYRTEIYPRLESKSIQVQLVDDDSYMGQLHALLLRGEVPWQDVLSDCTVL